MPKLLTHSMKGKKLYFDLRKDGVGEAEGFWAEPIFLSDEQRIERECAKNGQSENCWKEQLVFSIKDWEGFFDFYGKPIACTPEHLRELCDSDPAQMRSCLMLIRSAVVLAKEDTEKNF